MSRVRLGRSRRRPWLLAAAVAGALPLSLVVASASSLGTIRSDQLYAFGAKASIAVPMNLTVIVTGAGSVGRTVAPGTSTWACGSGCVGYPTGTAVTLTATADVGSVFGGWSGSIGSCVPEESVCVVTVAAGRVVTATFVEAPLAPAPAPTPTPDPGATATPTPDPGATATPGPDPTPTPDPAPTPALDPTPSPDPAPTPAPDPTPSSDPGPTPTTTP